MADYMNCTAVRARAPGADTYTDITTMTAFEVDLTQDFGLQFVVKNTSTSHTLGGWSVAIDWQYYDEDTGTTETVLTQWIVGSGSGISGADFDSFGASLAHGKSKTLTVNPITPALTSEQRANMVKIRVYSFNDTAQNGNWSTTCDRIAFKSESHYPQIDTFSVVRNAIGGDETIQLLLTAKGSYAYGPPESGSVFVSAVKLEVSVDGGPWTTIPNEVTVAALTSETGIVSQIMTYTLSTQSGADFRLTFYNEFEPPSVRTCTIMTSFAHMHLAGRKWGGVCFNGFCHAYDDGTEQNPGPDRGHTGDVEVYGKLICHDGAEGIGGGNIRVGTAECGSVGNGSYKDIALTFDEPFPEGTTVIVVVGFSTGSTAGAFGRCNASVRLGTETVNGFTARIFNGDSTNRSPNINYIAIGV